MPDSEKIEEMEKILKKVLSKEIDLIEFLKWLRNNKSDQSELSAIENSSFIPFIINFVKFQCAWLNLADKGTDQTDNNVNSPSSNTTLNGYLHNNNNKNRTPSPSNFKNALQEKTSYHTNNNNEEKANYRRENNKKGQIISLGCAPYKQKGNYQKPNYYTKAPNITDINDFPPVGSNSKMQCYSNSWKQNNTAGVNQFNKVNNARDKFFPNQNFKSAESFPPLGHKTEEIKTRRRITPTPIQTSNNFSSKFSKPQFSAPSEKMQSEVFKNSSYQENVSSFQYERELLRATKNNMFQNSVIPESKQTSNNFEEKTLLTPLSDKYACPDPNKICILEDTLCLADIYSCLLDNLLVPNITAEIYFLIELLTSKVVGEDKSEDKSLLSSIHDCVYFAVTVLGNSCNLLQILDKATLASLKEIPYLLLFSPQLIQFIDVYSAIKNDNSTILPSLTAVPFQVEEDSRANFPDEYTFICFKKQRDLFYEMLREWQENSVCVDAKFPSLFLRKSRQLISINPNSLNIYHLARLFQSQLIASCMFLEVNEVYDELLNDIQKNFPDKFKKLQERILTPSYSGGLTSSPSFYGIQNFFAELITSAGCFTLNQHLINIFVCKILELNCIDSLSERELCSHDVIKDKYIFLLHTLRLLGKFLGYIYFLPYSKEEITQTHVTKQQLSARQTFPLPLNLPQLLRDSINQGHMLVTVPWIVEFLSMVDPIGKDLKDIQETLSILISLYHHNVFLSSNLQSFLFFTVIIGWLFEVLHLHNDFFAHLSNSKSPIDNLQTGIDNLSLIDKQLIHSCCSFLIEFKVLVYNFLNGIKDKKREVRKITPLSTAKAVSSKSSTVSTHLLEHRLEENFFFIQPSSVKKTTEFIAERMASKVIGKIRLLITSMKLSIVEDISSNEKAKSLMEISDLNLRKKCIDELLLSVLTEVYKSIQDKISDLINSIQSEICTMIPALLSEDTKSAVLDMSCKISFRMSVDKILDWCSSNLLFDAIKTDIRNKVQHMSKSDSKIETVSNLKSSFWLSTFRRTIVKINAKSYVVEFDKIESLFNELRRVITNETSNPIKKTIFVLSIDFYIALLVNHPEKCCENLIKLFIQFWSLKPKDIVLENLLINLQNFKFLSTGKNIDLSQKKIVSMVKMLLELKIMSLKELRSVIENIKKLDCSVVMYSKFLVKQIELLLDIA